MKKFIMLSKLVVGLVMTLQGAIEVTKVTKGMGMDDALFVIASTIFLLGSCYFGVNFILSGIKDAIPFLKE